MYHDLLDVLFEQGPCPHKFSGKARKPFAFPFGPSVLDRDALTFRIAKLAEC
jgi:hypothetical protein